MKKVLFVLSMMLMSVCVISCSNKEESVVDTVSYVEEESSEKEAFEVLRQQIACLNESYGLYSGISEIGQTRISFFKRFFATLYADAVGGIVGAGIGGSVAALCGTGVSGVIIGSIVGGTIGSVLFSCVVACAQSIEYAFSGTSTAYMHAKQQLLSELVFADPSEAEKIDSIGYYHDSAILNIFQNSPNLSSYYSASALVDSIFVHHDDLGISSGMLSVSSPDSIKNRILSSLYDYFLANEDDETFTTIPSGKLWNDYSEELSLAEDYAQDITSNYITDVHGYTSRYLDLISGSTLTQQSKDVLKGSILVGYASYKLWNSSFFSFNNNLLP